MRFLYGLILGIIASVIAAILYLAFAGGEYLLALSPKYHDMRSRIGELEKAEQQRALLAEKLGRLEERFRDLARRFESLRPPPSTGSEAPPADAEESLSPTDEPGTEPASREGTGAE